MGRVGGGVRVYSLRFIFDDGCLMKLIFLGMHLVVDAVIYHT